MVTVQGNIAVFRFYRPQAQEAFLVGDFNQWQEKELRMARSPEGYWVAALRLPVGTYRFRYRADGQWFSDYAAFGLEIGRFGPDSVVRVAHASARGVCSEVEAERSRALAG